MYKHEAPTPGTMTLRRRLPRHPRPDAVYKAGPGEIGAQIAFNRKLTFHVPKMLLACQGSPGPSRDPSADSFGVSRIMGCFANRWSFTEPGERCLGDLAEAQPGVAVDPAAEALHAVVEMKYLELFQADFVVESLERGVEFRLRARADSPAAKTWQVSKQTPSRSASFTGPGSDRDVLETSHPSVVPCPAVISTSTFTLKPGQREWTSSNAGDDPGKPGLLATADVGTGVHDAGTTGRAPPPARPHRRTRRSTCGTVRRPGRRG